MDRQKMAEIAEVVIARQDDHDVEGIVSLFAEDCTFMMPVLPRPLRDRAELREHVSQHWPESVTSIEWLIVEGDRLVCLWSWQGKGEGWPEDAPLRGMSTFVFNDQGLIQDYEDFFDPDWTSRHG